jgi:pyruvate/2-oxoglutarate/acetoin dehydrogenase E1 component
MATDLVALVATRALEYLDEAPRMVTAPHSVVPFSPVLEDLYVPSEARVLEAILAAMGRAVPV